MQRMTALVGISAALFTASAAADWQQIRLDHVPHGRVLSGETLGPATAHAVNFHHDNSPLVAFDTRERETRDPDLEGPDGKAGHWTRGNLGADQVVGTVLIVQAPDPDFADDADTRGNIVAQPDNEERHLDGSQPGAGEITLAFDRPVAGFRFTLIDIEHTQVFESRSGSYVVFESGDERVKIAFAEFVDRDSAYYDPSIRFGDHSANRMPAFNAEQLGFDGIERVVINLGGSGAVGGLSYLDDPVHDIGFGSELPERSIYGGGHGSTPGGYAQEVTGNPGPGPGPGTGGSPNPKPGPKDPDDDDPITPTSVPTPGAGVAGAVLMSLLVSRRPRKRRAR